MIVTQPSRVKGKCKRKALQPTATNKAEDFLSTSLASCCSLKTKRYQILYLWSISPAIQQGHGTLSSPKYFFIHWDSTTEISVKLQRK